MSCSPAGCRSLARALAKCWSPTSRVSRSRRRRSTKHSRPSWGDRPAACARKGRALPVDERHDRGDLRPRTALPDLPAWRAGADSRPQRAAGQPGGSMLLSAQAIQAALSASQSASGSGQMMAMNVNPMGAAARCRRSARCRRRRRSRSLRPPGGALNGAQGGQPLADAGAAVGWAVGRAVRGDGDELRHQRSGADAAARRHAGGAHAGRRGDVGAAADHAWAPRARRRAGAGRSM